MAVSGCHTRPHDADDGVTGGITEGVLAPLADLNVRREEIPPILRDLNVYEKPVPTSCAGIEIEILDLEAYVGSDIDALDIEETTSLRGQVSDLADDQAYKLVSDLTTDLIPFRSVVRRATGANAHDRAIREAYRNGRLRRSYLKGVGFAMGCDSPAAPRFPGQLAAQREAAEAVEATTFRIMEVPPAW
ncbi:hypothetical protein [Parvularcula lutaonensis]|uniref:Uncharacterized protein n=2 Tax=Parvularcula lutaonensis TaxID=491923 RepID=A0ABV7M914_9PROT